MSESRDQTQSLPPFVKPRLPTLLLSLISAAVAITAAPAVSDYLQISPLPKCGGSIPHSVAPAIYCFIRKLSSPPGFEPTTVAPKSGALRPLCQDYDLGRVFLDSSTRAASVIGSDCLLPPNSPWAVGTLRSCKVSIVSR